MVLKFAVRLIMELEGSSCNIELLTNLKHFDVIDFLNILKSLFLPTYIFWDIVLYYIRLFFKNREIRL